MYDEILNYLGATALTGGIAIVIVLLGLLIVGRYLSAVWKCRLITVALLGFVFPWHWESALSLRQFFVAGEESAKPSTEVAVQPASLQTAVVVAEEGGVVEAPERVAASTKSGLPLLFLVWAGGALILAGLITREWLGLWRKLRRESEVVDAEMLAELLTIHGAGRASFRQIPSGESPFVFGIFRPTIFLPAGLGGESLRHVLRHELAHVSRRDVLWNIVVAFTRVLHWYHPLSWLAGREFFNARELACDEMAVAGLSHPDRSAYGQTILDLAVAHRSYQILPTPGFPKKTTLMKQRIERMMNRSKEQTTGILGHLLAGGFAAVVIAGAFSVPTYAHESGESTEVRTDDEGTREKQEELARLKAEQKQLSKRLSEVDVLIDRIDPYRADDLSNPILAAMHADLAKRKNFEFSVDDVVSWQAGKREMLDGRLVDTGKVRYKAQTIFGVKEIVAIAFVENRRVLKWAYASSRMEIGTTKR